MDLNMAYTILLVDWRNLEACMAAQTGKRLLINLVIWVVQIMEVILFENFFLSYLFAKMHINCYSSNFRIVIAFT